MKKLIHHLSERSIQTMIDRYIQVFNHRGYMNKDYIPGFTRLLQEKLERNEC